MVHWWTSSLRRYSRTLGRNLVRFGILGWTSFRRWAAFLLFGLIGNAGAGLGSLGLGLLSSPRFPFSLTFYSYFRPFSSLFPSSSISYFWPSTTEGQCAESVNSSLAQYFWSHFFPPLLFMVYGFGLQVLAKPSCTSGSLWDSPPPSSAFLFFILKYKLLSLSPWHDPGIVCFYIQI